MTTPDLNLAVYRNADVVAHYAGLDGLTEAESHLVERHIAPGARILDLGVGGGRTTAALAARGGRYVGLDFSTEMIAHCRTRFPDLEFHVRDAADLSPFADASFDAAVFSINGLDYLVPDEKRRQCLREIARVLTPGGVFIVLVHNARCLFAPPYRRIGANLRRLSRRLRAPAVWRGEGYLHDAAHGGLYTHVAASHRVIVEAGQVGSFELLERVGCDHPRVRPSIFVRWFYFAFRTPRR